MSFESRDMVEGCAARVAADGDAFCGSSSWERWAIDPLDPDEPGDDVIVTTSRRMLRIALTAADAGWRFAQEGIPEDPAAWMLTPRAMFDGAPAIEACQELDAFERAVVLNGLGGGLDADPELLDDLRGRDDEDEREAATGTYRVEPSIGDPLSVRLPSPLLLTCWIDERTETGRTIGFGAMVTDSPVAFVDRMIVRFGAATGAAEFDVGFDAANPLVEPLLADPMAALLREASDDPEHPALRSLDVCAGVTIPC